MPENSKDSQPLISSKSPTASEVERLFIENLLASDKLDEKETRLILKYAARHDAINCEKIILQVAQKSNFSKTILKEQLSLYRAENKPPAEKNGNDSSAELVDILHQNFGSVFLDQFSQPFVDIKGQALPLHSRRVKAFASKLFFEATTSVAGAEKINSALSVFESYAYEQPPRNLYTRIAWDGDRILYDLSDMKNQLVSISTNSWHIVDGEQPLLFRRWPHQKPQALPADKGDVDLLRSFLNVGDIDWRLLKPTIVTYFIPGISHPITCPSGTHGSGKSLFCRLLKRLVDPSIIETSAMPRDMTELIQKLSHHYFLAFDNLSTLHEWQSDTLCRAVTGEGFSKRQLYTDQDDVVFSFRSCIALNGINVVPQKPDLLDRSILFSLEHIDRKLRQEEEILLCEFEKVKPQILAGIFDILSRAISIKPKVSLYEKPRMADFAVWGEAVARAMSYKENEFLNLYLSNIAQQNAEAISASVLGDAVLQLVETKDVWEGTATQLLEDLEKCSEIAAIRIKHKAWPQSANSLSRRLNEIRANLQDMGIVAEQPPRSSKGARWRIRKVSTENTYTTYIPTLSGKNEGIKPNGSVDINVDSEMASTQYLHSQNSQKTQNTGVSVDVQIMQVFSELNGKDIIYADLLEKSGLDQHLLDAAINQLITENLIFEPRPGYLARL